jgi:hypothetical protein
MHTWFAIDAGSMEIEFPAIALPTQAFQFSIPSTCEHPLEIFSPLMEAMVLPPRVTVIVTSPEWPVKSTLP